MTLSTQLNSGIRVLDIRCRHIEDVFAIHHGIIFQNAFFGGDVLEPAINFLAAHPGETILMRVQEEHTPKDNTRSFEETFQWYMSIYGNPHWQGTSNNPTLGELRGKIVILQNFPGSDYGLSWSNANIQDNYNLITNWDLYDKWIDVRNHLNAANTGNINDIYINFLSGSGGSFPYFVASGHSSPGTGAPRLSTGLVDPISCDSSCYPDFPRVACWDPCWPVKDCDDLCTVAFEGTNELTMDYINHGYVGKRIGMIIADFPGRGLITEVIDLNPWNWPPVADANGPYVADEASPITFDASASTDADGDSLSYRWDFENDGTWDTNWSGSPSASHTWLDDWVGTAKMEVSDTKHSDSAEASVTVNNVNPVASIDSITDETGAEVSNNARVVLVLLEIDVAGSFTDVGILDTHTADIDWGNNFVSVGEVTQGAGSGEVNGSYTYSELGIYNVTLTVTDDDGGVGTATSSVTVVDASGAMAAAIEELIALAADPNIDPAAATAINKALGKLRGNYDGRAANGALDMLEKDNCNAALVGLGQAIQALEAAEAADATINLSPTNSLFALASKSVALEAIAQAEAVATRPKALYKVAQARALVAQGDERLAASDYVGAVDYYRDATQKVQGIKTRYKISLIF
jgi:1-phosphatidylinositol phosphodiesterase